ncbi:uncharacterized protein LOC143067930 isoform X2 [Mytilus galloprovincialis]|uniref:uncharacterized protein LOC143067930 isoform X2 n=1 Tax=Mytilus galloprovincialis TaxID=29158 RepID=UPI003F7C0088
MDDCNLDKLVIKPGKLTPAFHKDTTEYNVTLASNVEKIHVDPLTSDTGASYCISGSDGGKDVPLKEGQITDIKIEVTSEDCTIKNYFIHAKRLSAKDATLSDLKLSDGDLSPEFSDNVFEYSCLLPCNSDKVTVTPIAPDPKNEVLVCKEKPGTSTPLNVGETNLQIEVTSADGSNKQTYSLDIIRKPLPRYVKITDDNLAQQYECPISLSPLYRPITIKANDEKHTYSAPNIDAFTRTSKIDPLSGIPLTGEWRIVDYDLDKKMANAQSCIPLTYGGTSETKKYSELGSIIDKTNVTPKPLDVKDKFKDVTAPLNHTVQVRKWEKQMQQCFDDLDDLKKGGEEFIQEYYKSLPKPGESKQYDDGCTPLDYLQRASHCIASAIKLKPKDPNLHLQLGKILEEKYYCEDLFGQKKEEHEALPSFNLDAKESSRDEECAAICKLRGVDASSAPIALQLKAIDQEYHHLIENGQSVQADRVMGLFAWKSKQASQEGMAAQKATDEENPLGQAYLKYMDALVIDEAKAVFNFHVGRLLVIQGNFSEAAKRLEVTLNWNPNYQMGRFYLGLALALQKEGPGARVKEAVSYLLEAMETLLTQNTKFAMTERDPREITPELHSDNLIRSNNVHLLRGIVQLGRLLTQNADIKDCISGKDVLHTAALLAAQVLPNIAKGDAYKQFEWVLLESHATLLEILMKNGGNEKLITQRCQRLSSLIFHSTLPMNEQLLTLQEKTCQKLVQIQPCNAHSLYLLGLSQFAQYENCPPGDKSQEILKDCKSSYESSIELEGKPASGNAVENLVGQAWWQARIKQEEEKKKAVEASKTKAAPTPAGRGAPARGAPAGRGAPARGAPAARGTPAARGKGPATPAARGAPAGRGAARGTPAKVAAPAKAPAGKTVGKPAAACHSQPAKQEKTEEKKAEPQTPPAATQTSDSKPSLAAPINRKTYLPRLGLARAHRSAGEIEESQKYYNEVIVMAPEIHDAYIELAEMLTVKDPQAAVDVYCKFPLSETPTFDDAYIIGDIVRLLMKGEKYDDPRLQTNMIAYGRVLGLGVLEKYVKILEDKFKTKILREVYAGVNGKSVDDQDMQAFFKFKVWV